MCIRDRDITLFVVSPPASIFSKYLLAIISVLLVGLGSGIYLIANLGPGPRDGLMTGLTKKTRFPIASIRATIEISAVIFGWYLGGTVGLGTLIFAFGIGPAVALGIYFVDNITEDLFVDGYLAGSLLTNKMEVTTATMAAEADYVSRMGAAGAAVTGSFDVDRWEVLPTLALDYSSVSSQDASFEVTFGGGNSNELSSPGNVKQLSLTFSPDFRTSFDYYDGYWAQGSTFSLKPKFTCQRINQGTITKECGKGTALSLITQDEDAMKTLSFTLGVDKIAGDTTYSANALYKFEF